MKRMIKRKTWILAASIIAATILVCLVLVWQRYFVLRYTVTSESPDKRYTATVDCTIYLSVHCFDIKIINNKRQQPDRNLVVYDKIPGWTSDPTIKWDEDSKSVTVGLIDPDANKAIKKIEIDVP
jgi:hypothetical protein